MADIDLKTETPDGSLPSDGFLFGADSQSAAAPSVYTTQAVATTLLGSTSLTGATLTASSPVLNLSQTWNNAATSFALIRANATDTASASGSLLMDLQVGGFSNFRVGKLGDLRFMGVTLSNSQFLFPSGNWVDFEMGRTAAPTKTFAFRANSGNELILGSAIALGWNNGSVYTTMDLILGRRAAANLRLGAADAAAPVAQTLSVQSVVAGTTNTAGQNFTITGSQGTGNAAGGSIIFQVAPAGSSGTAQNALATALTIAGDRSVTFERVVNCNFSFITAGGYANTNGWFAGAYGSETAAIQNFSNAGRVFVASNGVFAFGSTASNPTTFDVILVRDGAANTLALRNGANAQTFNIYNTYTDASNYERLSIGAVSGERAFGYFAAGTGSARSVSFGNWTNNDVNIITNSSLKWQFKANGNILAWVDNAYDIGASGANRPRDLFLARNLVQVGAYHEMAEMTAPAAPATNGVRIYAEDDGAGKTRLMARFATGAAVQIAIEP